MPKIHPTKGKLKREWITVMKIAKQTPIYFQVERSQGKNSNMLLAAQIYKSSNPKTIEKMTSKKTHCQIKTANNRVKVK